VRPMARQGFKRKSGQSLEGWKTAITRLVETGEQVSSEAGAFKDGSKLISDLEKLARYYQETPAETARFTREAEVLRHISQISNQRVELIRQLSDLLQQVN
jgi:ABC-type transporter Mla subunit MlaD